MTSAHRPTFDHAKGKEKRVSSSIVHKRALNNHSKLKFRNKKIKKNTDFEEEARVSDDEAGDDGRKIDGLTADDVSNLRNSLSSDKDGADKEIEENDTERIDKEDDGSGEVRGYDAKDSGEEVKKCEENVAEGGKGTDKAVTTDESGNDSNDSNDDSDDDSDDEALLREIELIKQEREAKRKEEEEKDILERAKNSNPLLKLNTDEEQPATKKKSWRSSAKTMNKQTNGSKLDRFSNDTLKSDFHKDFLSRYVKQ